MENENLSIYIEIPNIPAFSNAIEDMDRAINEIHAGDYSIEDFEKEVIEDLPIADAVKDAGVYVPFISPGSLAGQPHERLGQRPALFYPARL